MTYPNATAFWYSTSGMCEISKWRQLNEKIWYRVVQDIGFMRSDNFWKPHLNIVYGTSSDWSKIKTIL